MTRKFVKHSILKKKKKEIDKPILKLIKKFKGLRRAEIILKNKNKAGRITLPNCKAYDKPTTIKTT